MIAHCVLHVFALSLKILCRYLKYLKSYKVLTKICGTVGLIFCTIISYQKVIEF